MNNSNNVAAYDAPQTLTILESIATSNFGTSDLMNAAKYLRHPVSAVLEVGPGSGRCLDYFLQLDSAPEVIVGIEVSSVLVNHLTTKYREDKRVSIVLGSVLDDTVLARSNNKFDAVLVMWSTLMEFSPAEQQRIFLRCAQWLTSGGLLLVDVSNPGNRGHVTLVHSQPISYDVPMGGQLHVYLPSPEEMAAYAQAANLKSIAVEDWTPPNNVVRRLYVFEKP
ncbi:hypothetical protein H310_03012 [Aphanomyces invadans]|uniref:Methyltransferase domain-containing protein n=1 Tax=Aphanomyces invadans TaxID=157072 RepID=A0A024UMR8_9STRA|nr:hypothetical protein H310_03012 [Aphanomyces invadans]ETW06888.1 hypothetical protein H310_03012 [Aphanomyces invadans]|eukprot:XP_008864963.1 hypothetical protein H310_03012 [Aphanomyces invadans]